MSEEKSRKAAGQAVSPYLRQKLRTLEQAQQEQERLQSNGAQEETKREQGD